MELALVGVTGKLGRYLHHRWAPVHRVHAFARDRMDLRNPVAVRRVLEESTFDALVNCAAVASPEACEAFPADAHLVNAESPGVMAEVCQSKGARMVQFSTDYVLEGTEPGLKDEAAPTGPVNHYGRTKLEGEQLVLDACPSAAVCRISWVFGTSPSGFLQAILSRARNGEALEAVADKWSMPGSARDIARVVEMLLGRPELSGVFHVVGPGEPESWWSYGRKVLEMAENFRIIEPGWELVPKKMADIPQLSVPRQAHTAMEPGRLVRELGWLVRNWEVAARDEVHLLGSRESH